MAPKINLPSDTEQAAHWCLQDAHALTKNTYDLTHSRICLAIATAEKRGITKLSEALASAERKPDVAQA